MKLLLTVWITISTVLIKGYIMQAISEISKAAFLLLTKGERWYTVENTDHDNRYFYRCHDVTLFRRETLTGGTTYHVIDINA